MFCSLKKGITPVIHMLRFVIINSVLLNLFGSCFRTLAVTLISGVFFSQKTNFNVQIAFCWLATWNNSVLECQQSRLFPICFSSQKTKFNVQTGLIFLVIGNRELSITYNNSNPCDAARSNPWNPYAAASDGQGHWILTCTHVYAENSCMCKYTRQCKNLQVLVKEQNNSITVTWLNPFTLPMADWNTD